MKRNIFYLLFFVVATVSVISCNNSTKENELNIKERELALKEKELELKEKSIRLNEDSVKQNKTEVSELNLPKKVVDNSQTTSNENQTANTYETNHGKTKFCYVYISTDEPEIKLESSYLPSGSMESKLVPNPSFYTYKSSIAEIKNFTQDDKYKLTDQYESQVRQGFSMKNMRLNEYNSQCTILSSKCFVFDTYRAASEHRRNN